MQFRNLIINSERYLHVKNNQLVIADGILIPLEDINCIIIDNQMVKLSAHLLQKLSENQVLLYLCDEKHLPASVLLPIGQHSRHYQMLKYQMECKLPLKKQIWQKIIRQKIMNQSETIKLIEVDGSKEIMNMVKEVKSGDSSHVESKAAALFFRKLFGDDFSRRAESKINSALNYGYAIIRGMIARSVVVHGLEPSIGIWHKSELNSFNLVDDLLEPFRPLVDLYITFYFEENEDDIGLSPDDKKIILSITQMDMLIKGNLYTLKDCVEEVVNSYCRCLKSGQEKMIMPQLYGLHQHRYE